MGTAKKKRFAKPLNIQEVQVTLFYIPTGRFNHENEGIRERFFFKN